MLELDGQVAQFLDQMFKAVKDGRIPKGNPFNDLFDQQKEDKKYSLDYLHQMAKELYSTLSRTIHNFKSSRDFNQYTIVPGQFDPMQMDFMRDMEPKKENFLADEGLDWEKERRRYPGQVLDDATRSAVLSPAAAVKNEKKKQQEAQAEEQNDKSTPILGGSIDKQLLEEIDLAKRNEVDLMAESNEEDGSLQGRQTVALEKLATVIAAYLQDSGKQKSEASSIVFGEETEDEDEDEEEDDDDDEEEDGDGRASGRP
ncbi:hypothetical protein BU26DRAFT_520057 [Trematosphaeria pertusa]|uniref:Uncharacterized protein n=1 Tax=Trematosphaeria pertusa TaxID=390896 RepID=A0A6A6ICQ6_9PLEO|nr:uncharacterized protein BU26DRAFT_520057 [Trematosphaeria pertusa]KAF2248364.1 hypothetical protein BU26DRAFT_520057 [Trematosphaeria pertusa]